jgi:hypothetical protein
MAALLITLAEASGSQLAPLPDSREGPASTILSLGSDQRWRGRRSYGPPARPFQRTA